MRLVLFLRIVNRRRRKKRRELLNWTRIGHAPGLDPYEGEERGHVDSLSAPLSLSFPFPFWHQSSPSRLFIEFASVRLLPSSRTRASAALGHFFRSWTLLPCLHASDVSRCATLKQQSLVNLSHPINTKMLLIQYFRQT